MSSNYSKYHSDTEAIILYIIGFIVIFLIISGNFLVIIAVVKDKTLKNLQNWFIGKINMPLRILGDLYTILYIFSISCLRGYTLGNGGGSFFPCSSLFNFPVTIKYITCL